jgi:hypothetical protein
MMQNVLTLLPESQMHAESVAIEVLRQASPWQRMQIVAKQNAHMRRLLLAGLRRRYPDAGKAELRRRLADLLLGPQLAELAYGSLEDAIRADSEPRHRTPDGSC